MDSAEGPHMGLSFTDGPGHPQSSSPSDHRSWSNPQVLAAAMVDFLVFVAGLGGQRVREGPSYSSPWSSSTHIVVLVGPDVPWGQSLSEWRSHVLVFVAVPARQGVGVDLRRRQSSATHIVVPSDQMPVGLPLAESRSMSLSSSRALRWTACRRRACRRSESATHIVVSLDHMPKRGQCCPR